MNTDDKENKSISAIGTDILDQFNNYLKMQDYSDRYFISVKRFLKYCSANSIDYLLLSNQQLADYLLTFKNRNIVNENINNQIKAIRYFYKWLLQQKLVTNIIVEDLCKIPLLRVTRKVYPYLNKKEIKDMIEMGEYFIEYIHPFKLRALIWFWFFTGLRLGELLQLKRSDFDLANMSFIVKIPTKNKCERIGYYNKFVKEKLETYFKYESEKTNAFNISRDQIYGMFKQLKPYVPKNKTVNPITLRRSFARYLCLKNVNMRTAQKLLGHKKLDSTAIYYDPDDIIVEKTYRDLVE